MKFLLLSLLLTASLLAAPQDEVLIVQELIDITKKNLDAQQKLLNLIVDFKKAREAFLLDPESAKRATFLVKKAMQLHAYLAKESLSHLFSTDFLVELDFYNKVGQTSCRP